MAAFSQASRRRALDFPVEPTLAEVEPDTGWRRTDLVLTVVLVLCVLAVWFYFS